MHAQPAIAVAILATMLTAACREETVPEVDLSELGTGERRIQVMGAEIDLAFSAALDECTLTVSEAGSEDGGPTIRTTVSLNLAALDLERLDTGTWDNGSLGYIRLFARDDIPRFDATYTLEGSVAPEDRQAVLARGGTCEGDPGSADQTCVETFATDYFQMSIRGPNPPQNTGHAAQDLTTRATACAATEEG